ncbi:SHOCT domain-containing protein [uncultured Clostridium sp.]|uniref:SHOCT domain-containing protein n=1 Tax=uncultured Clostridium sp. TaxID=59620 RepID=UPI0025F72086|nr:SHOCT domain-containing protein [uncultured Clostridium sp.]
MQITKLTGEQIEVVPQRHQYTEAELQREYDYILAQKMGRMLLDKGLISVDEFNKISERNRQTFSPYLAEIMP